MRYFELLKRRAEWRKRYIENMDFYLKKIKEFFVENLEDVKLYVFGSFVRGELGPNSDIDILVVSPRISIHERGKLLADLDDLIGAPNPFEFHLINPELYEEWYSHFIKEKREI
jgi:predicted nucleotidyltransferase